VPLTAYARSKREIEQHLAECDGMEKVIFRNATVFGVAPRMRFDLAINGMVMRAVTDGLIYVMGGGNQWRPFIHIDDVVSAFIRAVTDLPAGTYNVGYDRQNLQIGDLAKMVQTLTGAKIHRIPDQEDRRSYHVSFAKVSQYLSPVPVGVSTGIMEVLNALKAGAIAADDPTAWTVRWYKNLMKCEELIDSIRLDGRVF